MKRSGFKSRGKPLERKTPIKTMQRVLQRQRIRQVSKKRQAKRASPEGKANAAYLAAVRGLPCCICDGFGFVQTSDTQAHHVIHGRGGNEKTADTRAIPLCEGHHQGDRDTSKIALHREPDMWKDAYGLDTEYTAATQDVLAAYLPD